MGYAAGSLIETIGIDDAITEETNLDLLNDALEGFRAAAPLVHQAYVDLDHLDTITW